MNNPANNALAALKAKLPKLDALAKLPKPALLGAGALLVALLAVVFMWSRGPEYRVLFSNLEERDGGAIVTALGQMNVPYKFSDNGNALLVPADKVYDTRLQLASQGLPRGGSVGFELLDQSRFGASQFSEQINYQRSLEGELARSIEALHSVERARVHLALPRQSLFVRDRQPPTASVLLTLYPGRQLGESQVSSITWLVASSVPNLTADNVSIVDQNGRLLSHPDTGPMGADADQLRYVQQIEQRAVERILTLLNPLVGPGNVHAQVSAQMDFAQREETSEIYRPNQTPGQAAVRSRQTSSSNQTGPQGAIGVPGALTNQPPVNPVAPIEQPPAVAQQGNQQGNQQGAQQPATPPVPTQSRHDDTTNYEVDRTISHTKQPVGVLTRMSVAVVVNYRVNADGEWVALPEEEIQKLETLVREAVGYSEQRGDTVSIANSQFNDLEPSLPVWRDPYFIDMGRTFGTYLLILLLLIWFWRAVIRPMRQQQATAEEEEAQQEVALEEQERMRQAKEEARERKKHLYENNLTSARELAMKDPRAVAMIIRTWTDPNGSSKQS